MNLTAAGRARMTLAAVIVAQALLLIDITIVSVGLPEVQRDLGGSLAGVQWIVAAYALTMAACTQTAGTLSDRLGRRRIYVIGIAVFTVASVLCGLAQSVALLDMARGLQGVGAAMVMANSLPLIVAAYEGPKRTMAIAIFGTVLQVAGAIAPVFGGAGHAELALDVPDQCPDRRLGIDHRARLHAGVPAGPGEVRADRLVRRGAADRLARPAQLRPDQG
ncbi:hypothetical protein GCM10010191_74500 [Actinomadura vinacea]|uniref:Major facilitator superfamily (MFS) profile domain-containing protein n=1 Tax=Actinomadura vinacea TaxID=115336 RepID=A0ABP5XCK2_9ACTN